jgi:hypothetical protein
LATATKATAIEVTFDSVVYTIKKEGSTAYNATTHTAE